MEINANSAGFWKFSWGDSYGEDVLYSQSNPGGQVKMLKVDSAELVERDETKGQFVAQVVNVVTNKLALWQFTWDPGSEDWLRLHSSKRGSRRQNAVGGS